MFFRQFSPRAACGLATLAVVPFSLFSFTTAQAQVSSDKPAVAAGAGSKLIQKSGRYQVELRLPASGVFAGEESDLEFRISDLSKSDPVLGAPGVVRAVISGSVMMPVMPGMPRQAPKFHAEGVPGDYGLVTTFPHGGDYKITLTIAPPGGKAAPFAISFPVSVGDADEKRSKTTALPAYTLTVQSNPAVVTTGQKTTITVQVKGRDGKPVTQFDELHTMPMHLILVRDDLSLFFHEHPTLRDDGTLFLDFAFPTAGTWRVFADCAPHDAGGMVLQSEVRVVGASPARAVLPPPTRGPVGVGDAVARLQTLRPVAKKTLPVTFSLADKTGKPITDIQPWLGAMGHLILIEKDGKTFVHAHPDETDATNGKTGKITFLARFPKPGTYKVWLQFQRSGGVVTIPFVVQAVAEAK